MREKYVTCDFCGKRFNTYETDFWTMSLKHEARETKPNQVMYSDDFCFVTYSDGRAWDICNECVKMVRGVLESKKKAGEVGVQN